MSFISSLFLIIALGLAVVIGPQTRPWSWGPAMLALGISVAAALPKFWRKTKYVADFWLLAFATMVVGWFAWRAWTSPVWQLGEADLMLLAGAVGAFISIRTIEGNKMAERILLWGIALLLLSNVWVIAKQVTDPSYSPLFKARAGAFPSGFYAHYNEAANYLIASSLIIASAALLGKHGYFIRIVWGVIAISGLVAVYFTHSRGGILGAAIGCGVFACCALVVAKRHKSRWFAVSLIGLPLVIIASSFFLLSGWEASQKARNAGANVESVLDNNYRLFFLGIAVSAITQHPWIGGGSRSFSWESFQFLETTHQGTAVAVKPEQVHNELVQAATDYGIIGAGLLIGLLGALTIIAIIRILFQKEIEELSSADAWRAAGLAALAGMFVQSCFSFVFHLLPGTILLGICLGQMARFSPDLEKKYPIL
ncbi:MAG: O-antigen ligase family protein [Akkermansiaceae bacterium]|nr:O-antigen ligase family protein [Akkermansiaceae bacterium]